MKWTSELPTEPGWYWRTPGIVVRVYVGRRDRHGVEGLMFQGGGLCGRVEQPEEITHIRWAGPIPKPSEVGA